MRIKCSKCGYEWNTESKMIWVTCPSCRLKVKNKVKTDIMNRDITPIH